MNLAFFQFAPGRWRLQKPWGTWEMIWDTQLAALLWLRGRTWLPGRVELQYCLCHGWPVWPWSAYSMSWLLIEPESPFLQYHLIPSCVFVFVFFSLRKEMRSSVLSIALCAGVAHSMNVTFLSISQDCGPADELKEKQLPSDKLFFSGKAEYTQTPLGRNKSYPSDSWREIFQILLTWKWRSWTQSVEYHWHLEWVVCHHMRLSHLLEHIYHSPSCPLIAHDTLSHCNSSLSHFCVPSGDTVLPLRLRTPGKLPSSNIPHGFLQPFPQSVGHQASGCLPANSLYDWGSAVEPIIPCQVEASRAGPATLLPSLPLAADISLAPKSSPDTCWPRSLMVGKKWNVPDFSLILCHHVASSWKDWFKSCVLPVLSLIVSRAPLSRSWNWN